MTITLVLADDHPVVRAGVRATLEDAGGFAVLAEAACGATAWRACEEHRPDILVLDVQMPGPSTEELLDRLQASDLPTRVVIFTADKDLSFFQRVRSRVCGYLLKDEVGNDLAFALRAVRSGAVWLTQQLAWHRQPPSLEEDVRYRSLTPRERVTLAYLAHGVENKLIAAELHVAEQTVRNYVSNLYDKMGFKSRAEAVVWARERRLAESVKLSPRR